MADLKAYSTVSNNYDKMIKWNNRLAREIPFFTDLLTDLPQEKILDCACATGQHLVELAKLGFQVTGSDLNPDMLKQAQSLAKSNQLAIDLYQANFLELTQKIDDKFGLVMCIGNSLPHITNLSEIRLSIQNMYNLLKPNGKLVIQNRNYDKLLFDKYQLMPLTKWQDDQENKLFIRINELNSEQKVSFTILTLTEDENKNWRMEAERTELYPIQLNEIDAILRDVGFSEILSYGDYQLNPFEPKTSGDLIIVATK
jgi:glycine/sarcosine N-methyltransferase